MASLLKPHPPLGRKPGAAAGPSSRSTSKPQIPVLATGGAFDALLRELTNKPGYDAPLSSRPPTSSNAGVGTPRNRNGPASARGLAERSTNLPGPSSAAAARCRSDGPPPIGSRPTLAHVEEGMAWPDAAVKFSSTLTPYEGREIQGFDRVYYCGQRCKRKVHGTESPSTNNHGYDDGQSDYRLIVDDHVAYRYHLVNSLGRGSFGQVFKAIDCKTQTPVALKVIKNKKKFHEQALVEVKILKHLNAKDPSGAHNVVNMITSFAFRSHMVIVFELHGQSLYDVHKASRFAPMSESAIRNFAKQMLRTLVLTHRERVVHCDLKPENVLLKRGSKTELQVIDFGSACFDTERLYTYIQSRFYRAPEVMLGIPYTPAIDMWSLGCMLAEFSNGYPLFPGESEGQQMLYIMETFGPPPRAMLDRSTRKRNFFDAQGHPKLTPDSRGKMRRPGTKSLGNFVQCHNPAFLSLLEGLLTYEPERRLTPTEALRHPFFGAGSVPKKLNDGSEANVVLPQLQSARGRRV